MKKKEKVKKKHPAVRIILLSLLVILIAAAAVFMRFGGFSTGKSANAEEFKAVATTIENITIPVNARVVALGEATHGNADFQQLKLDVFKVMVENYGVRAFALEGDFGGCEQANRYIHDGEGTAQEAAAAVGFAIYRTEEMAELISYMREYNETAAPGDDLRFYGFDMQRYEYSFKFLVEACKELDMDTTELEKLMDGENWSDAYDRDTLVERITQVKTELESKENSAQAVHFADMLLQNFKLGDGTNENYADMRDGFMAESVKWIAEQEKALGHDRIFISGHNGHVARMGYDNMGKLLADALGDSYYVIGTDFYKTNCNMPKGSDGKRTNQVFYSHDPLANASKKAGLDICWLDFSKVSEGTELYTTVNSYIYMGSLGEGYKWFMRVLPPSYRIFQQPTALYNGMIFVTDAQPTVILAAE